jgi:hypothetical protein
MANEHWYRLKVRAGFAAVVAQRLRTLSFAVVVPGNKLPGSQQADQTVEYVYCRFGSEYRSSVTLIPGVLDILGTPEPTSVDANWPSLQLVSFLRP